MTSGARTQAAAASAAALRGGAALPQPRQTPRPPRPQPAAPAPADARSLIAEARAAHDQREAELEAAITPEQREQYARQYGGGVQAGTAGGDASASMSEAERRMLEELEEVE